MCHLNNASKFLFQPRVNNSKKEKKSTKETQQNVSAEGKLVSPLFLRVLLITFFKGKIIYAIYKQTFSKQ